MKKTSIRVRIISFILSCMISLTTILPAFNMVKSEADMTSVTGQLALGSPLLSDQFTLDDWNYWEMLAFGVFISNFCVPFQDDYSSAFTSGSTVGSRGRGLEALKFSAGGDANAEGYLRDMLQYCIKNQQSYKKIKVRYKYYEYNQAIGYAGGERDAVVGDLFPYLVRTTSGNGREVLNVDEIKRPSVNFVRVKHEGSGGDLEIETLMDQALLSEFYVDDIVIFSLSENWDVQMLKGIIAKNVLDGTTSNYTDADGSYNSGFDDFGVTSQLSSKELNDFIAAGYPLFMDTFGNIAVNKDGRNIIIVPAACNCHLTDVKSYNYLNSLIVNNLIVNDYNEDLAVFTRQPKDGLFTHVTKGLKTVVSRLPWLDNYDYDIVGNSPATTLYERIDSGRVILGADTLALSSQDLYEGLKKRKNGTAEANVTVPVGTHSSDGSSGNTAGVQGSGEAVVNATVEELAPTVSNSQRVLPEDKEEYIEELEDLGGAILNTSAIGNDYFDTGVTSDPTTGKLVVNTKSSNKNVKFDDSTLKRLENVKNEGKSAIFDDTYLKTHSQFSVDTKTATGMRVGQWASDKASLLITGHKAKESERTKAVVEAAQKNAKKKGGSTNTTPANDTTNVENNSQESTSSADPATESSGADPDASGPDPNGMRGGGAQSASTNSTSTTPTNQSSANTTNNSVNQDENDTGSRLVSEANRKSNVSAATTYEHYLTSQEIPASAYFLKYGDYIAQLIDLNSDEHQRLQLYVTDASTFIEQTNSVSNDSSSASGSYAALCLVGTGLAPTTSNSSTDENILNYFYNFKGFTKWEDAKTKLFKYSYFLTPTIDVKYLESKYYVNYYLRMMTGQQGVTTYGYSKNMVSELTNELKKADSADELYNVLKTKTLPSSGDTLVNPVYLSFLSENTNISLKAGADYTINSIATVRDVDFKPSIKKHFTIPQNLPKWLRDKKKDFTFGDLKQFGSNVGPKAPLRVVKVYQPNELFKDIGDIYSLDSSANFELLTPMLYVTYLKFYGLIDGGKKSSGKFNETLFATSSFRKFSSENFGTGLTKEERDEQSKLNVYRLLSLNAEGEKYRTSLLASLFKSWCVTPLDASLTSGTVGNVGSSGDLLDIHPIEETFWLGNIMTNNWERVSFIVLFVLVLLTVVTGALNARGLTYYIGTILATVMMIQTIPVYVNLTPTLVSRFVDRTYGAAGTYWALVDSINYSENQTVGMANGDTANQELQPILDMLTFLDADNTLMIKMDISQKIISNSTLTYDDMQRLTTLRWLLPAITQQIVSSNESQENSFVSVPVNTMYDNFLRLWIMYTGDTKTVPAGMSQGAFVDDYFNSIESYPSYWTGYTNTDNDSVVAGANSSNNSQLADINTLYVSRASRIFREDSGLNFVPHKVFYLIKDLPIKAPSGQTQEGVKTGSRTGLTVKEWTDIGKSLKNSDGTAYVEGGAEKFKAEAKNIKENLNTYNKYQDPIEQSYGYLWTTENLGPYFYLVAKETFSGKFGETQTKESRVERLADQSDENESESAATAKKDVETATSESEEETLTEEDDLITTTESNGTVSSVLMQIQGDIAERGSDLAKTDTLISLDEAGDMDKDNLVRVGVMHMGTTGWIVDVCDMEEVFTNLMPYMYEMMVLAGGDGTTTGLLEDEKMTGHTYYSANYMSWLFRSNWVAKLYEDRYYASSGTVRDKDGNSYTVSNMMDPYTYPASRPMVFSEAQMGTMGLEREDLNLVENNILVFNQDVVRRWTNLLNYANLQGLEPENLYRQMAIDALFAFNKAFAKDNIIMTENTLYPVQFNLRKVSQITVLRSLICNIKQDNKYSTGKLAEKLYGTAPNAGSVLDILGVYFMLWAWAWFKFARGIGIILLFIVGCLTVLINWRGTAHDKFRALAGCVLTSLSLALLTILYYYILYLIIGKPVVDSIVDVEKVIQTPNRYGVLTWGLFLFILSIIYLAIIALYFLNLFVYKKFGARVGDGGFGVFESGLQTIRDTVANITGSIGAKLGLAGTTLASLGPGGTYEDSYSYEKNHQNIVLNGEVTNNTQIQNDEQNTDISGMNETTENFSAPVSTGENEKLTQQMNGAIEDHQSSVYSGADNVNLSEGQSLQNGEYARVESGQNPELSNTINQAIEKDTNK